MGRLIRFPLSLQLQGWASPNSLLSSWTYEEVALLYGLLFFFPTSVEKIYQRNPISFLSHSHVNEIRVTKYLFFTEDVSLSMPGSVGGGFCPLHNLVGERGSSQMLAELRAIFQVWSPDTIGIHPLWNYLNFILKNSLSSKLRRYPNREMVCSRHNQHKSKGISSSRWACPAC